MSDRVLVSSDWSAVESWLTAYHSKDPVLLSELQTQLAGGHKVHSLNAALIYGIDPADAKTHLVNLKGRMVPAYDAGKRLSHAFNYGIGNRQGARTFWISEKFMATVSEKLNAKYAKVAMWRMEIANRVYGEAAFVCRRCTGVYDDDGDCPECTAAVGVPIPLRFAGYKVMPARRERTAFGRHRHYLGRRRNGANALASQHPQSCGASMWNITFARLHGYDPVADEPWPSPAGVLRYSPTASWADMFKPAPIFVATGKYDSFDMEAPRDQANDVARWLLWTMEQAWPELDGWRFPAEVSIGGNLGKYHERDNPNGLREITLAPPLTMVRGAGWQ